MRSIVVPRIRGLVYNLSGIIRIPRRISRWHSEYNNEGITHMKTDPQIAPSDLERREFQLSVFACLAIVILAGGLALLMYPAVFSSRENPPTRVPQVAFYGFCTLSCLLVAYIVDRQITIHRLRYEMALDRKRSSEALRQASADLLSTMPNFNTFEDRLTMEFRRAAAAELKLSVLVISIKPHAAFSEPSLRMSALGDAAKVISRKLREEDSIFILRPSFFGVILPSIGQADAKRFSGRIAEGLSDAAGANDRFSFKIEAISYPEQTSTARDLELVVSGWLPEGDSKETPAKDAHAYV
jgi:GGDEF domain-containing protein